MALQSAPVNLPWSLLKHATSQSIRPLVSGGGLPAYQQIVSLLAINARLRFPPVQTTIAKTRRQISENMI
jgi:hypothetical protein